MINQPLLLEWLRNGKWFGSTGSVAELYRTEAEAALASTPERYYWIAPGRIRISYYEPSPGPRKTGG